MSCWGLYLFGSESEATNFALTHLRDLGYTITLAVAGPWETPKQLLGRLGGLHPMTLFRRGKRADCPVLSAVERGPTGRIVRLRSNAEFDAFMQAERI